MSGISSIRNALIKIDQIADYIPAASTVTNLVDIFEKCAFKECKARWIDKDRYFSHVKNKNNLRCIVLLVPLLGNIIIGLHDLIIYKRIKKHQDFQAHALGINIKQLPWSISKRNKVLENKRNEKLQGASKQVIESLDKQIVGLRLACEKFKKIKNNPQEPLETNAFFEAPKENKSHKEKIDYFWSNLQSTLNFIDGGTTLISFGVLDKNEEINQRRNVITQLKNDLINIRQGN